MTWRTVMVAVSYNPTLYRWMERGEYSSREGWGRCSRRRERHGKNGRVGRWGSVGELGKGRGSWAVEVRKG